VDPESWIRRLMGGLQVQVRRLVELGGNLQLQIVYRQVWGRTRDPLLRRQMLYPPELRAHILILNHFSHRYHPLPAYCLKMTICFSEISTGTVSKLLLTESMTYGPAFCLSSRERRSTGYRRNSGG
jgi:hypothetical protein